MGTFVYILYSASADQFYRGITRHVAIRLKQHNNGEEKATRAGVPWQLLWKVEKPSRSEALRLEWKFKHLTRRRLVSFMLKYPEGVQGPDECLLLQTLSGC